MKIDLRRLRLTKGWTQTKTAESLGISLSYVKKIEQGERSVTLKLARRIADVFGCESIDDILQAS